MLKLGSTTNVKYSNLAQAQTKSTKNDLTRAHKKSKRLRFSLTWLNLLVKRSY